jgi:NAD+ synthase (glutamine-hydrolysing)
MPPRAPAPVAPAPPAPVGLAVAQLKPAKGNYAANLGRLGSLFRQLAAEAQPTVLHLPETVMTGYFLEGGVRDVAVTAGELARDVGRVYAEATGGTVPLDVVVGFYERWRDTLHNSAAYLELGGDRDARIVHVHRKNFLPTYGLFDEERFVERGHEIRAFDTRWGRAAMLVCEDAWHSISGMIAALKDAQVIFLSAAAPARGIWPREDGIPGPASVARWDRLVRDIAEEHGVFVSLANLVGSEGGKIFPGGSMVAGPRGDVRGRAPVWDEAVLPVPLDLSDLARARADMPLLADLRTVLPHLRSLMDGVGQPERPVEYDDAPSSDGDRATVGARGAPPENHDTTKSPTDHHHSDASDCIPLLATPPESRGLPPSLAIDAPLVEQWLVSFIRDEMRRRGFSRAVLGLSGGVDSAVTAVLAARALGPENVTAVRMPYRTSSKDSLDHAQLVIDALGIDSRTIDISAAVDGYLAHEPDAEGGRRGNVMARMRMIALFDLSARYRALPLGTGNKSERLLGYFTWHADDSPPINPLGDLFKTQVWTLATHLGVPDVIVRKPASADLIVGQTDEGDFGVSYARADDILNWLLFGYSVDEMVARGFDAAEIALVRRRLEGTHWKRRLPAVAMVSPTAIGESYLRPVDY